MVTSDDFVENLYNEVVSAIATGSTAIAVWGINSSGLRVLSTLYSSGLLSFITVLVDDRPMLQGKHFFGFEVHSPASLSEISIDTLVVAFDSEKERVLEEYARISNCLPKVIFSGDSNYDFNDPVFYEIVRSCPVKSKAGGYSSMLIHLFQALKSVAERNLQGDVAEFGIFQGGTTVFMAKVLKYYGHPGRIYAFDTFTGFPPRKSVMDNYSDKKCEFQDQKVVAAYCSPFNIELVPGDICETYTKLHGIPLALSFFDTDNYSATKQALGLCFEQTIPTGILAFDHYFSPSWNKTIGERIAVNQFLKEKRMFNLYQTGIFIKM